MKMRIIGLLTAIIAVATLSACGGGGGGGGGNSVAPRVESPFASAAMFVPTGDASKSFAVSGCTRTSGTATAAVTSATVVIQANGDMVFSGAIGAGAVAEISRINFADINQREVYGTIDRSEPGFEVDYYTADRRAMYLDSYDTTGGFYSASSTASYNCTAGPTTTTLTLQQPLSQARVVSNIVTGSTGTVQLQPSGVLPGNYTQTGSIVSWDSGRTTGTFARFISFNLDTAQFGQGNSLNPSAHTPVAFALPALDGSIYGFYDEWLRSNGDKSIEFIYDNIFVQYRRYADPAANSGHGRQLTFHNRGGFK